MADTKISDLAAASALTTSDYFPVVQGGATKKVALSETQLLDLIYPVGSVVTLGAAMFGTAESGVTAPEMGAGNGYFAAFDKATTETLCIVGLGAFIPRTWLTVNTYLEVFNFTGGSGNVVWEFTWASAGAVNTTVSYPDGNQTFTRVPSATTHTLDDFTVAGVAKKGGAIKVARLGANGSDTLDGDIHLAAVHLVRVT